LCGVGKNQKEKARRKSNNLGGTSTSGRAEKMLGRKKADGQREYEIGVTGRASTGKPSFLTAAVQNMKRLARTFFIRFLPVHCTHSNSHSPVPLESGCLLMA
jgi:hypothetical protein